VRRVPSGSRVELLDGVGGRARATIRLDNTVASAAVEAVTAEPPPAATVVAVGAGDRDRFIALAERCTELGITRLVPLITERSHHVATGLRDAALRRARRRALEACKQCRRAWATVIDDPCDLAGLAGRALADRWLLAHRGGVRCPELDSSIPVGWIIGPEGGLTDAEAAYCIDRIGATPVTFGRAVLRFDTAAVAAAILTADRRSAPEE